MEDEPSVRATAASLERGARRREQTRRALIGAARLVMARRGIESAPIAEITAEAGVAVGSFYNHFSAREEIVEAVIADAIESHGAALDRLTAGTSDPARVFATSVRLTVRLVDRDPVWGWFAVRAGPYIPLLRAGLGRRLARDLRSGFRAGRFASYHERTTLAAIGGAVLGVMQAKLLGGLPREADCFLAEELLRLLGLEPREAAAIANGELPDLDALSPGPPSAEATHPGRAAGRGARR